MKIETNFVSSLGLPTFYLARGVHAKEEIGTISVLALRGGGEPYHVKDVSHDRSSFTVNTISFILKNNLPFF